MLEVGRIGRVRMGGRWWMGEWYLGYPWRPGLRREGSRFGGQDGASLEASALCLWKLAGP